MTSIRRKHLCCVVRKSPARGLFLTVLLLLLAGRPGHAQASLRVDGQPDALTAELSGGTFQGGFRPDYAASSQYAFGAFARGRKSVGKAVFEGSFSFDFQYGKAMSNSLFIHPGLFPLDVLEFTPGDKMLRSYAFHGGVGVEVSPHWILGAQVSFRSEDYSKRKDIRHTNYGLYLDVEPDIAWTSSDGLFLQLGVRYRRLYEQIKAERLGSETAGSYYAFLDKGLSYGTWQLWDGAGIHLNEAGVMVFPVSDDAYGLSLAFQKDGWSARLAALRTSGHVGEKGYDWFRFPGWEAEGMLQYDSRSDTFLLQLAADADRLEESVLEKVSSGGVVTPVLHGWNVVSRRRDVSAVLGWTRRWTPRARSPRWEAGLSLAETYHNEHSFLTYPYTDRWDVLQNTLKAHGKVIAGAFEVRMALEGTFGLSWEQGLSTQQPDVTVTEPFRYREHWNAVREYAQVPRVGLNAGLNWYVPPVKGLYLRGDFSCLRAFGVQFLPSPWRFSAFLGIGYTIKYR